MSLGISSIVAARIRNMGVIGRIKKVQIVHTVVSIETVFLRI